MIVVAQKGEQPPRCRGFVKAFSGDARRAEEYRHDNHRVCIDPRGGVRACVRACRPPKESRASEREGETRFENDERVQRVKKRGREEEEEEKAFERGKGEFGRGASLR